MDVTARPSHPPAADADSSPARPVGPFVLGPTSLVRDIVFHVPGASRALEHYRIDYCCGGARSLAEICVETRVALDDVLRTIEVERESGGETDAELLEIPLAELLRRIVGEHHARSRADAIRLVALAEAVRDAHPDDVERLGPIADETRRLFRALLPHLDEEEKVLFPYVGELERCGGAGLPAPVALFATIRHVLVDMEREHEHCETILAALRGRTADYAVTAETPPDVRALFEGLDAHEKDLVRHMHLEGNVVFPRAERLESKLKSVRRR